MPYLWFNQIQAFKFWLNHTQGIIMNYFSYWLPHFWECMMLKSKLDWEVHPYFWMSVKKPLIDMPTLQIWETTLRDNVRRLIELELIERVLFTVEGMSRAYYRVTAKWLTESYSEYPSDFNTLYNILKEKIDKKEFKDGEITRINNLFSSSMEEDFKETVFSEVLDEIATEGKFEAYIVAEIKRLEPCLKTHKIIDENFYLSMVETIKADWLQRKWYQVDAHWNATIETEKKVMSRFTTMVDWFLFKKKQLKWIKNTIHTWYAKDFI